MPIFLLNRLLQAIGVLIAVAFFAFLLFQYVGDPVLFVLGQDATPEQVKALRAALGLDQSFLIQFQRF
jgi:peptide/nickel transport system permease protein